MKALTKFETQKLNCFSKANQWQKLSNFYNSQSTKYSGVLDTTLFIQSEDKKLIVSLGFSPLVKRIIRPNLKKKLVREFFENRNKQDEINKVRENEQKLIFDQKVNEAKQVITSHPELIEKYGQKAALKFNAGSSRYHQYIAWKLSTKFPEITKTQFFHAM
jgi:hypothetical protein